MLMERRTFHAHLLPVAFSLRLSMANEGKKDERFLMQLVNMLKHTGTGTMVVSANL